VRVWEREGIHRGDLRDDDRAGGGLAQLNSTSLPPLLSLSHSLADLRTALAAATSIQPPDQILLTRGTPLDGRPGTTLAAFGLPPPDPPTRLEDSLFLFSRPAIRPDGPPPAAPALTAAGQAVPDLPPPEQGEAAGANPHPLDASPSPAARALPALERACSAHLAVASALWDAGAAARADVDRLARVAAVQAAAADVARASVEQSYASTAAAFSSFMGGLAGGADPAERLHQDLAALAAVPLHPAARRVPAAAGTTAPPTPLPSTLADLLPTADLGAWAARLAAARGALDARAASLRARLAALAAELEALLLAGPLADVSALTPAAADAAAAASEEQGRVVASLSADLAAARRAMDAAAAADADAAGGPPSALFASVDAAAGRLAAAVGRHTAALLPASRSAGLDLAAAAAAAAAAATALARDAAAQLRTVAAHQGGLRGVRADLSLLARAADKQAAAGAALARMRRLPAAYRACLAERVRRDGWRDGYAGRAAGVGDALAASAEREAARWAAFARTVGALIPPHVLASLGLMPEGPTPAVVAVPPEGDPGPRVTLEDVRAAVSPPGMVDDVGLADEGPPLFPEGWVARGAAPPPPPPALAPPSPAQAPSPSALDNARLRAEVAALRAADAAAVAAAAAAAPAPTSPAPASPSPRSSPASSGGGAAETAPPPPTAALEAATSAFTAALAARDDLIAELQEALAAAQGRRAATARAAAAAAASSTPPRVRVRLEVVEEGGDGGGGPA